ncbi:hypothetical protein [Paraconexibacter sp. AEG42_29]|uniref:hypothetical protein n=1 Tax=Paraconexibacter sp. AEG42_29 TaxID=2997339 RepID=UPI00339D3727
MLVAAGALVLAGSAAAAVATLEREPSRELAGVAPGFGSSLREYRVELRPNLSAGTIGWCGNIRIKGIGGGSGCGLAAPASAPVISSGGLIRGKDAEGTSLNYAVVTATVSAIRLSDGRRIVTARDTRLPSGWRAAVWTERQRVGRPPAIPIPLDAAGQNIADERAQHGTASGRRLAIKQVSPTRPPTGGPCAITVPRITGRYAGSEQVITRLPSRQPDVAGRPFLACATTVFYDRDARYRAALLLDARNPATRADRLPGQRPTKAPGIAAAFGDLTLRKAGPGWLVIEGRSERGRLRVLRQLRARTP